MKWIHQENANIKFWNQLHSLKAITLKTYHRHSLPQTPKKLGAMTVDCIPSLNVGCIV